MCYCVGRLAFASSHQSLGCLHHFNPQHQSHAQLYISCLSSFNNKQQQSDHNCVQSSAQKSSMMHAPATAANRVLHHKLLHAKPAAGSCWLRPPARRAAPATTAPAAAAGPMGPSLPPRPAAAAKSKPDWVRILEEDAAVDEEIAELLRGTDGDPDKIRAKMEQKLQSPFGSGPVSGSSSSDAGGAAGSSSSSGGPAGLPFEARTGSDTPPHITFREVDPFDLWVWLEFLVPPSNRERELLQSTLKSWFVVGKLGGFNSQNMQVYYNNSDDNSFIEYDSQEAGSALSAFMHSCSDAEFKGSWGRFHLDLGTADELALDVLLNMLVGFSYEVAGIARIMVGGEHERWEVPRRVDAEEELGWGGEEADGEGGGSSSVDADGRPRRQHGQAPKVGINPMKLPQGLEEELEMLDELGSWYNTQQQEQESASPAQQQQPQQQQQQPRREWGKGLKGLGGSAAVKGSILARQQQQQQQQRSGGGGSSSAARTTSSSSSSSSSNSRGGGRSERARQQLDRLQALRKVQQQQQQGAVTGGGGGASGGMTMYSAEEFKRAFGAGGDDSDGGAAR